MNIFKKIFSSKKQAEEKTLCDEIKLLVDRIFIIPDEMDDNIVNANNYNYVEAVLFTSFYVRLKIILSNKSRNSKEKFSDMFIQCVFNENLAHFALSGIVNVEEFAEYAKERWGKYDEIMMNNKIAPVDKVSALLNYFQRILTHGLIEKELCIDPDWFVRDVVDLMNDKMEVLEYFETMKELKPHIDRVLALM